MATGEGTHWHNSSKESNLSAAVPRKTDSQGEPLRHTAANSHGMSHSNGSPKAPLLCLPAGVRQSLGHCLSGKNKKKNSKENSGKKGEQIPCVVLGNHLLLPVLLHTSALIGCLLVFWPNIPMLVYKSCPTLTLIHTNVSAAVVEAAVSWIIAWRVLRFRANYEMIQTS